MKHSDYEERNKGINISMALVSVLGFGGLITLGIVIVFLLAGLWLDSYMGTKPFFTMLLMLVSAPISIFIMYRVMMRSISKIIPPAKKTDGESEPKE